MIYKPEFVDQARDMCRLGATDEELAEHFGVCVRTIYRWRNTHEEFAEAVVAGKEHADARVERALYSRAVGCSVQRTKIFKHASDPKPVYATYTHHFPPDPNAALQWLRARKPGKWIPREEKQSDPNAAEMIRKALDRVKDYHPPYPWPPRQPPSEATTPPPAREPEPPPGPEPAPDPQPPPARESSSAPDHEPEHRGTTSPTSAPRRGCAIVYAPVYRPIP